jgi:hypothetical protein
MTHIFVNVSGLMSHVLRVDDCRSRVSIEYCETSDVGGLKGTCSIARGGKKESNAHLSAWRAYVCPFSRRCSQVSKDNSPPRCSTNKVRDCCIIYRTVSVSAGHYKFGFGLTIGGG